MNAMNIWLWCSKQLQEERTKNMKINMSTEACKAHNVTNADYIAAGLEEAWEPNDEQLKREEKARTEAAAGKVSFKGCCGTYTNAQWAQIADLREGQRKDYLALVSTFDSANKVEAR